MASSRAPLVTIFTLGVLVLASVAVKGTDTTPPWAIDWGPRGTNVPTDTQVLIAWSERMNWSSVEAGFSYSDGITTYGAGVWAHDDASNTSVFRPANPLGPGKHYTIRIESTAHDVAGNPLDQNRDGTGGGPCIGPTSTWDCLVWSFDTTPLPPDTVAPQVLSTRPAGNGLAATNATIRIVFSKTMDTASVEGSFSYGDGYSLYTIADGTATWTASSTPDDSLLFEPGLRFASGGRIAVNLRGDTAKDLAGNLLDGNGDGTGGDDFSFFFSVAPNPTPAVVVYTHPSPGTGSNSISTTLRITFSKAMARAPVEASLSLDAAGAPTLTAANGSSTWVGDRFPDDTLYFDPYPNFRTATTYTLRLRSDLATDREGLHLDGNGNGTVEGSPADDYLLTFTTETADLTPPWVFSHTPAAGATDVPPTTTIRARFSEPMNRGSVEAAFSYSDGVSSFGVADGTISWSEGSDAFAFRPAAALLAGTSYRVTIRATARDEAGNALNAGRDEVWNFTTAGQQDTTAPWIAWNSPYDGQRNVSRTARISFIFSEAMDKGSVQNAMGITGGASLTDFRWPNDRTVEAATTVPMGWRAAYTVFVLTGAKDLAGNSLPQPAQIAFTTESWRGRVTGRVVDESGAGIANATVQLNGFSSLTNDTGGFAFESIEQGTYTLTVTRADYAKYTDTVGIDPEQPPLLPVTLHRAGVAPIDAAIWAAAGATLLFVLLVIVFLRRRRAKPTAHYETWKPAKVVTVEPGGVQQRERE